MLFRHLTVLAIASTATAFFAMDAAAKPKFSVENNSNKRVKVLIYDGDDSACAAPDQTKGLGAGETKTLKCNGGGTGRCKVQVLLERKTLCEFELNTCKGEAMIVKNGRHLAVTRGSGCRIR